MTKHDHTYSLLPLLLMALAFCLPGCTDHDNDDIGPAGNSPMVFTSNLQNRDSRAVLTETELKKVSLGVFGFHQKGTGIEKEEQVLFNNQEVTCNGDAWSYFPLKYWNRTPGLTYTFAAYAPRCGETASATEPYISYTAYNKVTDFSIRNYTYTLNNIPQWQDCNDAAFDPIVAESADITNKGLEHFFENNSNGTVNLVFHHTLARLTVKAEAQNSNLMLKSVAVGGTVEIDETTTTVSVPDGKASFTYDYTPESVESRASFTSPASVESYTIFSHGAGLDLPYDVTNNKGTVVNVCDKLVVPFTFAKLPISVTYTAAGVERTKTGVINITKFDMDTHYIVTIGLADDNISIDYVQVGFRKWDETGSGTTGFFNW